ncbi:hypothetical protein D9M68_216000 [compost metagenome]
MADEVQRRVAQFMRVVRRDRGRHADRDAGCAVCEQVREGPREHGRLLVFLVVGGAEIHRVLVDPVEKERTDVRHLRFGVSHRRGVIAIDVAEVALAVDERVADCKFLGQAHKRVVDRGVAVRVELTHDVADDAGAFLERRVGSEAHFAHRMHDTAMHGLQPVADVRKRAVHDGRQGIGKITLFQRRLEVNRLNIVVPA